MLTFWQVLKIFAVFLPAAFSGVPFTLKGYDVDEGTDPICWSSGFDDEDAALNSTADFGPRNIDMLPACYPGTSLNMTPLDLNRTEDDLQIMYSGGTYNFFVETRVNYSAIAELASKYYFGEAYELNETQFQPNYWFEFVMCDISKIGFCNPVALTTSIIQLNTTGDLTADELQDWLSSVDDNYGYEEGTPLPAIRLGNHIYTRWINWTMESVSSSSVSYYSAMTLTVTLPEEPKGIFFVIGHSIFNVPVSKIAENETSTGVIFVQIADAIPDNIVQVARVPDMLKVSLAMRIGLAGAGGFCALIALVLLVFCVYYRKDTVMKLAQWQFLVWLLANALFCCMFVFTFLPTKDWHCRYANILEMIPLTFIGAILVGRNWRVYVILSNAMSIGASPKAEGKRRASSVIKNAYVGCLTSVARFPGSCKRFLTCQWKKEAEPSTIGFRQKATGLETARLILWLSLPQIVFQVAGTIVFDKTIVIDFDSEMTVGREICDQTGGWVRRLGIAIVFMVYSFAVMVAWVSRDMPSAFKETDAIFSCSSISAIVALLAIALDQIADSAGTSPDITSFLWGVTSLIVCMTAVYCIVVPKVARVLSGEKVILSDLLNQTRESKASIQTGSKYKFAVKPSNGEGEKDEELVWLGMMDPIPISIERELIAINEMITEVKNNLVQGRTPKLEDWQQLQWRVAALHQDLRLLRFEWTEEDEKED